VDRYLNLLSAHHAPLNPPLHDGTLDTYVKHPLYYNRPSSTIT
jgi:hypothetical protein